METRPILLEGQDYSDDQLFQLLKDAEERLKQNGAPTSENHIALQKPHQSLDPSTRYLTKGKPYPYRYSNSLY